MSGSCCSGAKTPFDGRSDAYRRVLVAVIVMNAAMFVVEIASGFAAQSMALKADALDFLGDAATYGLSLWVIGRPAHWRSRAAQVKAASLAAAGAIVLAAAVWRMFGPPQPEPAVMGAVGGLALAVNVAAALLLLRFRDGDSNIRSVWLCSRNDAIGNVAVIVAAGAVSVTASPWPDLAVATLMASLFLHSSAKVALHARAELRAASSGDALEPSTV